MAGSRSIFDFLFFRTRSGSATYSSANVATVVKPEHENDAHERIWDDVRSSTMTSRERIVALCDAVKYVIDAGIPGDVVECGVWKGGSMMAAAKTLISNKQLQHRLWLYDTFDGMNAPTAKDVDFLGNDAARLLNEHDPDQADSVWCKAALQEVRQNLESTGYPLDQMEFVAGEVEKTLTIENNKPDKISILRLDTDWYESTRVALQQLYPRLQTGGVLIVDDYGHWKGCREAVDEFFCDRGEKLFFNRIDYTGRLAIKRRFQHDEVTRAN